LVQECEMERVSRLVDLKELVFIISF
jgi:hypothetical protein